MYRLYTRLRIDNEWLFGTTASSVRIIGSPKMFTGVILFVTYPAESYVPCCVRTIAPYAITVEVTKRTRKAIAHSYAIGIHATVVDTAAVAVVAAAAVAASIINTSDIHFCWKICNFTLLSRVNLTSGEQSDQLTMTCSCCSTDAC